MAVLFYLLEVLCVVIVAACIWTADITHPLEGIVMSYANFIDAFESKYRIGQRVKVDFSEWTKLGVKIKCTTGIITMAWAKFALTPTHRIIMYEVLMDAEWKKGGGSKTQKMPEEKLTLA